MKIKINNWEKYQQRTSGYRKCWWLSLSNTFLEDSDMWFFTDAEIKAWLYLLCQASQKQKPEFVVNFDHAESASRVSRAALKSFIEKAKDLRWLTVGPSTICTESVQDSSTICTIQNRTEQNSTVPKGTCDLAITTDQPAAHKNLKAEALLKVWNENCGNLPKAKALNPTRTRSVLARLKEHPDLEVWAKAAKTIAASPFHSGRNERGWIADFDYFIQPKTILKAIEGSINSKQQEKKTQWKPVNRPPTQEQNP